MSLIGISEAKEKRQLHPAQLYKYARCGQCFHWLQLSAAAMAQMRMPIGAPKAGDCFANPPVPVVAQNEMGQLSMTMMYPRLPEMQPACARFQIVPDKLPQGVTIEEDKLFVTD